MVAGVQPAGLCATCNNSAVCTRRKGFRGPVYFCEEFDDRPPRKAGRPQAPVAAYEQFVMDTALGLCCNCDNRGCCSLQESPGGVWHCEEYC